MKWYLTIILFVSFNFITHAQVVNDDCVTSTYLGMLNPLTTYICPDGTVGSSNGIADSNMAATPSSPFYSMSGCYGYASSTTTLGDDVWFKFRNPYTGIFLHIAASDTLHINVYHGINCSSLQPIGCWTFANDTYNNSFGSSSDTINEYNYIQVSGAVPGKKVYFALCIAALSMIAPAYFGVINITTNVASKNTFITKYFPNPFSDVLTIENGNSGATISIYNIIGTLLFNQRIYSNHFQADFGFLQQGSYILKYKDYKHEEIIKLVKQ